MGLCGCFMGERNIFGFCACFLVFCLFVLVYNVISNRILGCLLGLGGVLGFRYFAWGRVEWKELLKKII